MSKTLEVGKIPNSLLSKLLAQLPALDKNVVIPPGIGCDAAGIKLAEGYFSVTSDPITFATKEAARYSVSVNINDIMCMGCKPRYFSSAILLPAGITDVQLQNFWLDLIDELQRHQVQVIGGHMEVTKAVTIPVIVGQMIGELCTPEFYNVNNIKAGDQLLLWRGVALEGTALIATERFEELSRHIIPEQLELMQKMIEEPGICIAEAARRLFELEGIVALHDPTEGGVATAINEMADAANCGVDIDGDSIPVLSETRQLAQVLKFDPLGLLASGCLLIACKKKAVAAIMEEFKGEVIACVGEFTDDAKKRQISLQGKPKRLPRFDQDEIVKALAVKVP